MAVVQDNYPDNPPPGPPTQDAINRELMAQLKAGREADRELMSMIRNTAAMIKEMAQVVSDLGDRINGRKQSP